MQIWVICYATHQWLEVGSNVSRENINTLLSFAAELFFIINLGVYCEKKKSSQKAVSMGKYFLKHLDYKLYTPGVFKVDR